MAEIQSPFLKASTAVAASGGTTLANAGSFSSFWPTDIVGWMSLAASAVACLYSLTLWFEWWWKKFWVPLLRRKGWLK